MTASELIKKLKEVDNYKNTGKIAINKRTGEKCMIIREWETGQILVCEFITPAVFCTHDSWDTLELVEE